jgi:signal transduction histidine kinase
MRTFRRPWRVPLLWFRFGSLHARLLAAFVLVILATLLSAGSAVVWLVQDYQSRLAVDRLGDMAMAAAAIERQLEQREAQPDEIGAVLANQLGPVQIQQMRILLLDAQGRVLVERPTAPGTLDPIFIGRRLEVPPSTDRAPDRAPSASGASGGSGQRFFRSRATVWSEASEFRERPFLFITAPLPGGLAPQGPAPGTATAESGPNAVDRLIGKRPVYRVVLAIPQRNLALVWRELAPSLGLAALFAVPVSVAVALWLSRSITRPLRQITRAAEGIARGELRQTIPVRGRDEVAHLAQAFNIMSREVEGSHKALRDFLANASHELRTPLTSIQGFSQALLDRTLHGEAGAVEAGQIINEEAERMRRLVEDLLYLSRVEAREVPASRGLVDVSSLLREASRRVQLVAEQRRLELSLLLPELPPVEGDADELDRLFGNLLENAGKYTPEGGRIGVDARLEAGQVRVAVHNSGSFIPPEDLPFVFDRFYRVDKSRARDVDGSGLGLAIAREVAQRHGGTIAVFSDQVAGTTFLVALPATRGNVPAHGARGAADGRERAVDDLRAQERARAATAV